MATLPRYPGRRVDPRPLPDLRVPVEAPRDAFGVDLSEAERINAGMRQDVTEAAKLRAHVQDASLLDRLNKTEQELRLQVKNAQGENAQEVAQSATAAFDEAFGEVTKDMDEADQERLRGHYTRQRLNFDTWARDHAQEQFRAYADARDQATINSEAEAAAANFDDPERVRLALDRMDAITEDLATRRGVGKDVADSLKASRRSNTHVDVIHQFLSVEQDEKAEAYYQEHVGEIDAKSREKLRQGLLEGSRRSKSAKLAREILEGVHEYRVTDPSTGQREKYDQDAAKSLKEALSMARKAAGDDSRLEDLLVQRVTSRWALQEQAEKQASEALYENAWNRLAEAKSKVLPVHVKAGAPGQAPFIDIPTGQLEEVNPRLLMAPHEWEALSPAQQQSLQAYATERKHDPDKWADWMALSVVQRASMSKVEYLEQYGLHFDQAHNEAALNDWQNQREAFEKARTKGDPRKLTELVSSEEMVKNELKRASVLPWDGDASAEQKRMAAGLTEEAQRRVNAFERTLKDNRKATPEEVKKIVGGMLTEKVHVRKSFLGIDSLWADSGKPVVELSAEEAKDSYVPFHEIKPEVLDYLKKQLQSAGWTFEDFDQSNALSVEDTARVLNPESSLFEATPGGEAATVQTKDAIEKLYAAILTGDRVRATAILHSNKRK